MTRLARLLLAGDVLLVGLLVTGGEVEVAARATYEGAPVWPGGPLAALLPPLVAAPLLVRRRHPAYALAAGVLVIVATSLVAGTLESGTVVVAALVLLYSGATHLARSWPAIAAAAVLGTAVVTRPGAVTGVGDAVWFAGELTVPIVLGRVVALWRRQLATMRRQQSEIERLHRVEIAAATAAERAVVARELHDIVAHAVSVVVIQAQVGSRAVGRDDRAAARSLDTIESSGRAALVELRRLLTVLADGDGAMPPETPGLDAVLERVRAAGLDVDVTVDPLPELSPAARLALHRSVQEALTNALKHAPQSRATMRIRSDGAGVRLEVENALGPGGSDVPGAARGLIGMRERLALVGGTLEAGPDGDRFRVRAAIPIGTPA